MKTTNNSLARRLRDWIENGSEPLDAEMEDALREPGETPEEPEETWLFERPRPERAGMTNRARHENTRTYDIWFRVTGAVICVSLIAILLFAALQMPRFGGADTLLDNEVSAFYVENTLADTGAVNIVTGIILNYRGFDTLGESHVLFIAACTVLILLRVRDDHSGRLTQAQIDAETDDRRTEPRDDVILQSGARLLIPCVLLFGIYIIANGHLSPGGGFSGGAVIGAGFLMYLLAFGYRKTERFLTFRVFKTVSCAALMFYSLSKGYHFFTGANELKSVIGPGVAGRIFSGGLLLPLNVAVGCVVALTMYTLFTMFRKGDY